MIRINLIRAYDAPRAPRPSNISRFLSCLLGFALLAVLQLMLNWRIAAFDERRAALSLEIARQRSALTRATSAPSTEPPYDDAGLLEAGSRLRSIAAALPPDAWLISYDEARGVVSLRGLASSDEAPRVLVENLAALSIFRRVEIIETTREVRAGRGGAQEFLLKAIVPSDFPDAKDGGKR